MLEINGSFHHLQWETAWCAGLKQKLMVVKTALDFYIFSFFWIFLHSAKLNTRALLTALVRQISGMGLISTNLFE